MKKKILVLGGTGLLGKAVVNALDKNGFSLRLLVRDAEKAKSMFADSIELVEGRVEYIDVLKNAMAGCYGVHISIGGIVDQKSAENVAALAIETAIERITYMSGATVCEENRWFPMIAQKLNAEKAISECGVDYSIFRPTWPLEMLVRFARNGEPFMMGKQPTPLHFFALEDLGRLVSAALQNEMAVNQIFYVHGPEAIPMKEALQRYCRVFHPDGKPVTVMPLWLAKWMGMLSGNKDLQFAAKLMSYFEKIGELGDPQKTNEILGAPQMTLDEWMTKRQVKVGGSK